ncbi:hypothetical protein CPB84DRAFT_1745501 [Gymnopilus junonius]|uniref:Inner centromere protein ARK-binding domain-containing protein n=1 Tax=Gymnopilus junonius TaxID=109634 RepID=A0A9P5NUG1_GYMJU|nr:hypothetical protein CPB84DRAFT_1745501 [Gymnopilus junonius]
MAHQGLLSWANSVCLTMAKDPGREVFKKEVQTHGFLFLDAYLDNIVSGAKQDPLIELVKTPGRKKAIARKPKHMSSKLGTVVSLSFENKSADENHVPGDDSEMFPPLSQPGSQTESKSEPAKQKIDKPNVAFRPPLISIQPLNNGSWTVQDQPASSVQQPNFEPTPEVLALTIAEHSKDLSVIAEDEEPSERSHASTSAPMGSSHGRPLSEVSLSIPVFPLEHDRWDSNLSRHDDTATTSSSSVDTFHSISLRSPSTFVSEVPSSEASGNHSHDSGASSTQNDSQLLPPPLSLKEDDPDVMANPREEHVPFERKSSDKHSTPSFPTLPEPMPLRKSMKPLPRDPSLNAITIGAATPGGPVGGKRTSWLMKAREVKALEGGSKKTFAFATSLLNSVPVMPQGTKRKSEEISVPPVVLQDEERQPKIAKMQENEQQQAMTVDPRPEGGSRDPEPEVVLGLLKKTVEGLGIRGNKNLGKSLGGANAATVLAEARAAAEARVAERDRKEEEKTTNIGSMLVPSPVIHEAGPPTSSGQQNEGRLSISDLFPKDGRMKEKHKVPEKPFHFKPQVEPSSSAQSQDAPKPRESTSTTPPNSPPAQFQSIQILSVPQNFHKHTPVFVPPASTSVQRAVFNPPPKIDDIPPPKALKPSIGLLPSTTFKPPSVLPLTAQSTIESVQSDGIFDRDDVPAWMPSTQDTEYTYDNQTQSQNGQVCDEDDSWPVDEKLAAGVQWTFGGSKEDSMTWSTLPTQSQRGDTGPTAETSPVQEKQPEFGPSKESHIPGAFDQEINESSDEQDAMTRDRELEEVVLGVPKMTPGIMEVDDDSKLPPRSQSQMSMASSESSQSQLGFLGQASKLLSSALGTSKKKQPEVKAVLQKAAVAAKKRKAEEEKARILEEERKMKENAERRKKEREGNTEKRALKLPSAKKARQGILYCVESFDDESQKKRKIEVEKKQELKKPGPSILLGKSHLKSAIKQPVASSSFAYGSLAYAASTINLEAETSGTYKGKDQTMFDDEVSQPSQLVQSQMAALPSESIELPDINSEYSDSDDEDRVRTFDPPDWAQSPELRQALEMQSTINPDDIFGAVRPLKMEEIFKTRTSRFRARTSSANWTGTDRLTLQEEKDYARRMGFK